MTNKTAVAYFRTSSATNVGLDKDSERRQWEAVRAYAKSDKLTIVKEFYDAAVSGSDPVDQRPGFAALLEYCLADGVTAVLIENAGRFARDLMVQLTGHALLKKRNIELIPVDAPTYFSDPSPTAVLISQILGAVAQFEKASLVAKLRGARERTGHLGGRKPVPTETIAEARRLARRNPKTGKKRSLAEIANELAALGHLSPSGQAYFPGSIKHMLEHA